MTRFLQLKPSQILSIFLLFTLLLGSFAFPAYARSSTTSTSSSSTSHHVQAPSWLLSLLKDHQASVSHKAPTTTKGAIPMDIRLNKSVNVKAQTESNSLYYSPSEIRNAYNATSLLNRGINGTGVTISIVDAFGDPYIQGELDNFSAAYGIPTTTVHVVCVDGPCDYYNGIYTGWNGEIALDVEWAHAMAPGATMNLYIGSTNAQPLYDGVAAAVAGTNGNGTYLSPSSIISMSWGSPENDIGESGSIAPVFGENYPWLNEVFQQGAAEGMTFFASTGDWGAYDQAFGQASPYGGAIYPSTDPFVTAVGGTSLYLSTTSGYLQFPGNATGGYGYETAWSWNNYYAWATGSGFSTFIGQPSWQRGPGVTSGETRGVPDVSWDADVLTGVLVYLQGSFWVFGGTSVGSPSWAGSMALIDQYVGHDLGSINPSIYSILSNPSEYARAFHDVTVGNDDPLQAGPGWDPVTGVGSPNIGMLAYYLAQPSTSLSVIASSNVPLGTSADYTSVQIQASVLSGAVPVTTGAVSAVITSSNGAFVGAVTMTYNGTMWTGTYAIKPTDPPGMWTATVHAAHGSQSGIGATTFSVGDGITIFGGGWVSYTVNDTIVVEATVSYPNGSLATSGSFSATFYLGTPSGTVEGTTPLTYYSSYGLWVGFFGIPPSADQGPWLLSIGGTDSVGNTAAPAYAWVNVGLTAETLTDSPTYVLGDTIQILSFPYVNDYYYGFYAATTGSFNATIWDNGVAIGVAPLSYDPYYGIWTGAFDTTTYPAGFYRIVVTGNDGYGNSAYGETLVRVAPLSLKVTAAITPINNATETLSARVTYPRGTLMTIGSVDAFTSYGYYFPMTYNTSSGKFVAILPVPAFVGNVTDVVAYDPWGNSGSSPLPSATSISCAKAIIVGASSTCRATVSGNNPSGTVSWSQVAINGSVTISPTSCTLSSGQCQVTVGGTSDGSVILVANYTGDLNNLPSNGTLAITVSSVTVACTPASVVVATHVTCTATLTRPPQTPMPTGRITWSTNVYGKFSRLTCKLSKGSCTVTYTPQTAGTNIMTASYAGDKHNPASSGTFSLSVTAQTSTTTVSCSRASVVANSSKTVKCTATVKGYKPSGTVTWNQSSINGGLVAIAGSQFNTTPCSLNARGRCSVTITGISIGTVTIQATYGGNGANTVSYGTATLTVKAKH